MDKISEAKKSEILRREEAVRKGEVRVKESNAKLLTDIKEFNLLVDKKMAEIAEKGRILNDREGKINTDYNEIGKLKVKYNTGIMDTNNELKRLAKLSSSITSKGSELAIIEDDLSKRESKIKAEEETIKIKESRAEKKIKEFDKKIKEYLKLKVQVEDDVRKSKKISLKLEDRDKEIQVLKEVVEVKEKEVAEETIKLSEWNDSLNVLKADLRDRQRLIDIEEKEVRARQKVVEKIRKEIYKKGGTK